MAEEPTEFWGELAIDPVEIALPRGSGFTLRAYRSSTTFAPTDVSERPEDDDPFARKPDAALEDDEEELPDFDEEELTRQALAQADEDEAAGKPRKASDTSVDLEPIDDEEAAEAAESEDEDEDEDEEAEDEEEDVEEVPLFLTHKGRLLLFKSAEGLVEFVKSGAPNDMSQLPEWERLTDEIDVEQLTPADDDTYELDLVVENLRGGHDAWDPNLILSAGEVSRDIAYSLRLNDVLGMLSPGSPLDDLDEALRSAGSGGVGGFLAKRRVRKIGAQQASLGWRTVIGKISGIVDWRD
ncbi:putative nucleic acid-binding Zn-ribbon protein [Hamadaea flava]|uniref:DNA primase n=1 Tax=Hamadaea flava TaxID=1742688 RepID=A0ABV8LJ64_9ACTN|nr:DNA primase [Hamadaea flava]MCP2325493.1 putative nucleic acid-binding Zn-ribbon protein [Hamadaea flava]